jgi:phosphoribosylglycinamide formyltransferase-1
MIKLAVLVSGRGTNLQAIIDAVKEGRLDAEIKVVISNNKEAYAIERAKRCSIPVEILPEKDIEEFEKRMVRIIEDYSVDLIILAGFMRLLSPDFVKRFKNRIMNIHPALLPSFPGLNAQKKALLYGVKFSGCTVHFVDEGCDTGPVIIQAIVPVYDDDTEDTLSERILKEEHKIYPQAIQLFSEGRLLVEGRKVLIKNGKKIEDFSIANPPIKI